jgi:ribosomal protein S18 acetylase RimI-like enzyme
MDFEECSKTTLLSIFFFKRGINHNLLQMQPLAPNFRVRTTRAADAATSARLAQLVNAAFRVEDFIKSAAHKDRTSAAEIQRVTEADPTAIYVVIEDVGLPGDSAAGAGGDSAAADNTAADNTAADNTAADNTAAAGGAADAPGSQEPHGTIVACALIKDLCAPAGGAAPPNSHWGTLVAAGVLEDPPLKRGYAGMFSVDPRRQGAGLGSALVRAALDELAARGAKHADIVVVDLRFESLAGFYVDRMGFSRVGAFEWPVETRHVLAKPDATGFVLCTKPI